MLCTDGTRPVKNRRYVTIVGWALALWVGTSARGQVVIGKHPKDTVTSGFWQQNSNAETTVRGLNGASVALTNVSNLNSNQLDAATRALLGAGGGGGTAARALIATNTVLALSYDSSSGGWTNGAGTQVVGANGLVLGGGVGGTVTLSASTLSADASVITGTLLGSSVGAVTSVAGPLLTTNGNKIVPSYNGGRLTNLNTFTNRQEWFVDLNGTDSNPGTREHPFLTITNAIARMGVSNTLNIMTGTYNIDSNHIAPPVGYIIDGHGSTIISDPDDGAPKLRLRDNCTAFNLTLQCSSNSFNTSLFWGGVGNWNQDGLHSDFPATNFYVHHLHIHNAMSDVFYIGNKDLTNRYQGVIEDCDGDGFFDAISVGGTNNTEFIFRNCHFNMTMDPANAASSMIRSTGGNIICQNVNYTITNIQAINPMSPFVFTQDGSTKIVMDGGKWVFWNKAGQNPLSSGYNTPLNSGYMTGRFLYSTNGGESYVELTPGITNKWLSYAIPITALGAKATNINAVTLMSLNFQLNATAGSGVIGIILQTVSGTTTNQYFANGYNNSAEGDVTPIGFNGIPLNPNDFWWYDIDENTTSTTLFGHITLNAFSAGWGSKYWRQTQNPP